MGQVEVQVSFRHGRHTRSGTLSCAPEPLDPDDPGYERFALMAALRASRPWCLAADLRFDRSTLSRKAMWRVWRESMTEDEWEMVLAKTSPGDQDIYNPHTVAGIVCLRMATMRLCTGNTSDDTGTLTEGE